MRTLPWLIAALLLGSPAVYATNWFAVDTLGAGSGVALETDIDSLRQANARHEVTVRVSYPQPRLHHSGAWFQSVVATVEFQCDGRLADYRDAIFYSETRAHGVIAAREHGRLATSEAAGDLLPPRGLELLIHAACARPTPAVQ